MKNLQSPLTKPGPCRPPLRKREGAYTMRDHQDLDRLAETDRLTDLATNSTFSGNSFGPPTTTASP